MTKTPEPGEHNLKIERTRSPMVRGLVNCQIGPFGTLEFRVLNLFGIRFLLFVIFVRRKRRSLRILTSPDYPAP